MNGSGGRFSDDVYLAFAPARTYRELLTRSARVGWFGALGRPALVIVLIGTAVSTAATGRVSLGLVSSTALAWSFAVALQIAVGASVIASSRARRVGMPRAVDLWFTGHLPWSLWLLVVAGVTRMLPSFSLEGILLTMIVPMAWTAAIASAFCHIVLGTTRRAARLRAAAHQLVTLVLVLSFVAWSAGGWFRLLM